MKSTPRKATITKTVRLTEKNAAFQVVKKLNTLKLKKGTEVLVTDEGFWKGVKQYSLKLSDGSNPSSFKVTASQFQFSEKATFEVLVSRISYACHNIKVVAFSAEEAEKLALVAAGNYEFREHDATYEALSAFPVNPITA